MRADSPDLGVHPILVAPFQTDTEFNTGSSMVRICMI